jgi:hypothetical protein
MCTANDKFTRTDGQTATPPRSWMKSPPTTTECAGAPRSCPPSIDGRGVRSSVPHPPRSLTDRFAWGQRKIGGFQSTSQHLTVGSWDGMPGWEARSAEA